MGTEAFRELSPEECRARLRPGGVGRVGVSVGALPAIFPIHFAVLDEDIVVRVDPADILGGALPGAVVAFETGAMAADRPRGWSVLVIGMAEWVTEHDRIAAARALPLAPSTAGAGDQYTRIPCARVSGRVYFGPESSAPI